MTPQYSYRNLMEDHLGRKLQRDEFVHHLNGDPRDNRIENLKAVSAKEHWRLHYAILSGIGIARKDADLLREWAEEANITRNQFVLQAIKMYRCWWLDEQERIAREKSNP